MLSKNRFAHNIFKKLKFSTCTCFHQGIKYANCNYEGEIIKTYPSIASEAVCQQACKIASDCKYYLFEAERRVCKLLEDDKRKCDLVINTKETDFTKCKIPGGWELNCGVNLMS